MLCVVLIAVDGIAGFILRAVHLLGLRGGKLAAVSLAIRIDLLIDALFAIFQMGGFARTQTAVSNAIRNPILLSLPTLAYFTAAVMSGIPVVIIVINPCAGY